MMAFTIRRLLLAIPVLFIVMSLTFVLMRTTRGSPFTDVKAVPPEILAEMNRDYHLDGSLWQQYWSYMGDLATGDLRISTKYKNRSVNEILAQAVPVSLTLGSVAFCLAMGLGVLLGSFAAIHHNGWQDRAAMFAALGGISIPSFVLAPALIVIFAIHWRILPVAGWGSFDQLILPAICLSLPYAASIARLTRSSFLDVLQQDFVRTARAKGVAEQTVIYRHALKVAILPVVSYSGPLAANILTGSIVVESIFRIPGLGPFFVNSILNNDLFMVGGTVLVFSLFLIFFNLVVDILYFVLDRRIRLA